MEYYIKSIMVTFLVIIPTVILLVVFYKQISNSINAFINKLKGQSGVLLIFAILLYFSWLAFVLIKANELFVGNATFDYLMPERLDKDNIGFWQSVASSTLDSAIFLLLISSVIALRNLKDPKEEDYKKKIQNLFPEVDMKSDLGKYLLDKISYLACISPLTERTITIDKMDEQQNFIHLMLQTDCNIRNIHHNHPFSDKLKYRVKPDDVSFQPEYLLKVLKMQYIKHSNGDDNKKNVISHPVTIKHDDEDKTFKRETDLHLKPYETATYLTQTLMWQDLAESLNSSNVRYTKKQTYEIKNELNIDIHLKITIPVKESFFNKIYEVLGANLHNKKERLATVKAGKTHTFSTGEVEPGEVVSILFSKEEIKDTN